MKDLKIRFNTENTDGILVWRVLIDGEEHFASIDIQVPSYTSKDILLDGRVKYHITVNYTHLIWEENRLIIK